MSQGTGTGTGTGTPLVEARSLLSITTLASNPPAYPRNPTQKPHEQLVLYIVRVPGSKDVFLSPLKPPTKASVSPAALNASLYYLHVACPDDDAVLESIEEERRLNAQKTQSDGNGHGHGDADAAGDSKLAALNRVQRKPVSGATAPNPESTPGATTPLAEDSEYSRQLPPRPSWQSYAPYGSESGLHGQTRHVSPGRVDVDIPSQPPNVPPRSLPPAHADQSRLPHPISGQSGQPNRWSALPGSTSPQPPLRPPQRIADPTPGVRASWDGSRRPSLRPGSSGSLSTRNHPAPGDPRGDLKSKRSYDGPREAQYTVPRPFHVTLIRRDPTHGGQWNVGTITNSSRSCPSDVSADGGIAVEITTPGYNRFAGDNNAPLSLESLGLTSLSDLRNSMPPLPRPQTATPPSTKPSGPLKFERRVKLTNQYPHHRPQHSSHSTHHRHRSHDTASSSKSPKGIYTFTSPWNGTCTFTTGANGRSLKCRHAIPGPTTTTTDAQDPDGSASVTVAELRFNLPTFGLGSANCPQRNDEKAGSSGGGGGPFFPPDPDRLDLSLGRERAGGGMRGNSAKLGKLIIEDEGLKMLDLVVAACMGVWWKVYDHVQG